MPRTTASSRQTMSPSTSAMQKIKVLSVFGTRPDAVKMCPLVLALSADDRFESLCCVTAQHREMLDRVLGIFGIIPDFDLDIMKPGQSLAEVTSRVLHGMEQVLGACRPDLVLVHGDTTTCFAASLAAFYARVPVGHVEAGLRTQTIDSPFPEELNRRLTGRIAALHFAPTERAVRNLAAEGIASSVYLTGNTVIDAMRYTVRANAPFQSEALSALDPSRRIVLVTAHRRENWGTPLDAILSAVRVLSEKHKGAQFVFPVHPNPAVRERVFAALSNVPGVLLTPALDVCDMHTLLSRAALVLTDSGGLQEEAPALGVPVVVLRTETERPEAIESGVAVLAGVKQEAIVRIADTLLSDEAAHAAMRKAVSPFGDGHACERIADAIALWFGR